MNTNVDDLGNPIDSETEAAAKRLAAERAAMIQGLRDLASFLESNPAAPSTFSLSFLVSAQTAEAFRDAGRHIGFAAKQFDGEWVSLTKQFGPVKYEVFVHRSKVCEKRVVGTRTVPEHVEDVVEWECSDSLLKAIGE